MGLTSIMSTSFHAKTPSIPPGIEGVKYAVPPLIQYFLTKIPSRRQATPFAVSGENRLLLLIISEKPLREVFGHVSPLPCTIRQLSGGKWNAYFFPSQCSLKLR